MAVSLRRTARQATNGHSSCTALLADIANGSVLPQDLLYEILVRLPAKSLCRLRAVCRSWRSLLSESSFVAAHSARHGPLVAAFTRFVLGRASSKGEAKVLAVKMGSCKVLTLGGAGKWRDTGCPPASLVNSSICVALVKGVLYFMGYTTCRHDHIAAYNLETETWRPDPIHFPLPLKDEANLLVELSESLVAVYNSRPDNNDVFMDFWFLTDSEKVIWSKHYTITMPFLGYPSVYCPLCRLDDGKIVFWVMRYWKNREVKIVHFLRVYDPATKTYTDGPEMPECTFVGVYKGSLLDGRSSMDQELSGCDRTL